MDHGDYETFLIGVAPRILAVARILCDRREDAEDLAQEALMRIVLKEARVRKASDMSAYAHRILINVHRDRLRKKTLPMSSPSQEVLDNVPHGSDTEGMTTQRVALMHALQGLPEQQRAAVALRYLCDMEYMSIAATLGTTESTARANTSRGLTQIRESIPSTDTHKEFK